MQNLIVDPILTRQDLVTLYKVRDFLGTIIDTTEDRRTNMMYKISLLALGKVIEAIELRGQAGDKSKVAS